MPSVVLLLAIVTASAELDLETKKVVNYSNSPGQYDEPEGVFPDGQWTLVECDRESFSGAGPGMSISGNSRSMERRPGND